MYYPYLRAKQFELKALREFSEEHSGSNIVPILEPVKKQSVALERAVGDMMENKMRFALVLNPTDGDFKHDTVSFGAWLEESKLLLNGSQGIEWIPAFICTRKLLDDIPSLIEKYQLSNVMLVFKSCMDMEDPKVSSIVNHPRVEFVVNAFGAVGSRRLNTILKRTGKMFKMYKFRSMKVNAPVMYSEDGSSYSAADDPRVTKVGRFIRSTSLDETAQFLNILKGDMAFVGPRGRGDDSVGTFENDELDLMKVKPGITGYCQAYFRNSASPRDKRLKDAWYANHVSFPLDFRIVLKTIVTVIKRDNVYTD